MAASQILPGSLVSAHAWRTAVCLFLHTIRKCVALLQHDWCSRFINKAHSRAFLSACRYTNNAYRTGAQVHSWCHTSTSNITMHVRTFMATLHCLDGTPSHLLCAPSSYKLKRRSICCSCLACSHGICGWHVAVALCLIYDSALQNHQPATEGDWDERRLRALQGGSLMGRLLFIALSAECAMHLRNMHSNRMPDLPPITGGT
jgi:hypothetical protein